MTENEPMPRYSDKEIRANHIAGRAIARTEKTNPEAKDTLVNFIRMIEITDDIELKKTDECIQKAKETLADASEPYQDFYAGITNDQWQEAANTLLNMERSHQSNMQRG